MTKTAQNHTAIVAEEFRNMGFMVKKVQHWVIVSLNRSIFTYEIETALAQADLPEMKIVRLINGKCAINTAS